MKRSLRLRAAQNFHPLTGEIRLIAWWDCEACDSWLLDCTCEVDYG